MVETWKRSMRRAAVSGSMASAASALALAMMSKREGTAAVGPINAISHWLWGDKAIHQDGTSFHYTAVGYAIHHLSATFWAVLYEKILHRPNRKPVEVLRDAALSSAVACVVDFQLTPRRLTPGYERRLSRSSLLVVYGAFAIGLAGASLLRQRKKRR